MKTLFKAVSSRFAPVFAINLKYLRIFRAAMGLIVLYDLSELLSIYNFLVGPSSLVSIPMAIREGQLYGVAIAGQLSHLSPITDLFLQNFVLCLIALGALLLIFGRFVHFAQWALMFCYLFLFWRWPQFTHDGDYLMAWIFIWMNFLPSKKVTDKKYLFSYGTVSFYLQIMMFFTLAGLNKYGNLWMDGSAVGLATGQLNMLSRMGTWINIGPNLSVVLSYLTLFSEIIVPLFLVITFRKFILKKFGIIILGLTMLGIVLVFRTGNMALAGLVLLLPIISFPKKKEDIYIEPKKSYVAVLLLSLILLLGMISYVYNLDVLPVELRKSLAPYSIASKIPLKQSWRMYSGNPPNSVIAIRFYNVKNGSKIYRNFFSLEEVPEKAYFDSGSWYDLNIRYRRFQKYFERVYLKRGDFQSTMLALNKSLCDRLRDSEAQVGSDLWIKVLSPEVSYHSEPLSLNLFNCYTR